MKDPEDVRNDVKFGLWLAGLLFLTSSWVLALFTNYIHVATLCGIVGVALIILSATRLVFTDDPDE